MVKQNTPEWLEMRKSMIGASDAPIIIGDSPWKTPFELWELKTGRREDADQTHHQKRGHDMEPLALDLYNRSTGFNCAPEVCFSQKHTWMMASLDGIDRSNRIIVEIKCPGQTDHEIAASGKVPEKYFAQLQHQLAVTGYPMLHYWSFSGQGQHLVEVRRDDEYIERLIKHESVFYKFLVDDVPPPLTDRDYVQRKDFQFYLVEQRYAEIHKRLEELKHQELEAREELIAICAGQSSEGSRVKVRRTERRGNIDYSKIPQLDGVDLEPFRKEPTETWRVTLR